MFNSLHKYGMVKNWFKNPEFPFCITLTVACHSTQYEAYSNQ